MPTGDDKKGILSKYDSKCLQRLIKSSWVHIHFHQNMCVFAQRRCLSFLDEKFFEWRISWMKNFLGKVWNLHRGYFIMCKFQPSWHCTQGLLLLVMTAAVAKFCKFWELHFYWKPVMRLLGCNLHFYRVNNFFYWVNIFYWVNTFLLGEHFSYWVNTFLIFYYFSEVHSLLETSEAWAQSAVLLPQLFWNKICCKELHTHPL